MINIIGILIYRIFRDQRKRTVKIAHAIIMIVALLSAVIALIAVFDSHNLVDPPTANLYTIHSWVGISAVALFAFQVTRIRLLPLIYQSYKKGLIIMLDLTSFYNYSGWQVVWPFFFLGLQSISNQRTCLFIFSSVSSSLHYLVHHV